MRTTRQVTCTLGALLLLAAMGAFPSAEAARTRHHIGEPWEAPIDRGVVAQRAAVRRGTAPKQLVERALRAVRREDSITKLYLLGRAYGVRAQWHRARAQTAKSAGPKQRHQRDALAAHQEAMTTYREVLSRARRCYYAAHDMGVLTMQADPKATRAAFDHFRTAYRINDRYTPTVRQLIALYLAKKQFGVAVPLLEGLLQAEPKDDEARARLVAAYTTLGKDEPAYLHVNRLLSERPASIPLIALRADLDLRSGKLQRAMNAYQRIARSNPNVPTGFVGMIAVIQTWGKAGAKRDVKSYLFALKGLQRLTRDPKRREDLLREIRRAEHMLANPDESGGQGPPSTPQLLRMLEDPLEKNRVSAAIFLLGRKEAPTPEVLRATARRLSASVETSTPVRVVIVRGLGRVSGSRLAPLLRGSLSDPELHVRMEAADTLASVARRDPRISGGVIAVLGLHIGAQEVEFAAAARMGILTLTDTYLPEVDKDSDDAAWQAAFKAWWGGAAGVDVQIRALDDYHKFGDLTPDRTLVPYLKSTDFFVWRAAYLAFGPCGDKVREPTLKRWMAARPQIAADRLTRENWPVLKAELAPWVAARPSR